MVLARESRMKTVTFFSYKGGVGRTLAATNFAVYLAKLGLKVVIMDFDLEAPGVDSKFPNFELPSGQQGLIDYVLRFQRDGDPPGAVETIYCPVAISSSRGDCALGIIPAGDYLATDYPTKLNELDWNVLFSKERDGVAFFQKFLEQIEDELNPDVLVIDSRTGFSEIGGLCTQQLADETVILSSLASESIKMTRHLARVIRESEVARGLRKHVETKVVVSRVPKPRDVEALKTRCCKLFDVEEKGLFFLFSCRDLEREEFVAMLDTSREDGLVANYIQLFQGLDVRVAQESIQSEIERTESGLLSSTPEHAEAKIREMVALYPHPEVYRRAMRFFDLRNKSEDSAQFGLRLLDLSPDDAEAQSRVARVLLQSDYPMHSRAIQRKFSNLADLPRLLRIAERVYEAGQLTIEDSVQLASAFERVDEHSKSFTIASKCLDAEELDDEDVRSRAMGIAANAAMELGEKDEAKKLVAGIPQSRLRGPIARVALDLMIEQGNSEDAFELAKTILLRGFESAVLQAALRLGRELEREDEVVEIIQSNPLIDREIRRNPEIQWELERMDIDIRELLEPRSAARRRSPRRTKP